MQRRLPDGVPVGMTRSEPLLPRWLQIPLELVFGVVWALAATWFLVDRFGLFMEGPHPGDWATASCMFLPLLVMFLWSLRSVLHGTLRQATLIGAYVATLAWLAAAVYCATY